MELNTAGGTGVAVDVDLQSFEREVLDASVSQLVMVDFWAEWCGPCQNLGPILDKLAAEYRDVLKLVKVDTDKQQELAAQFGIRSLPTVVFLKDKQVVDHFMGVQPESEIRKKIDALTGNPVDVDCDAVEAVYSEGKTDEARQMMIELMQRYPDQQRPRLTLIEWLSASGDLEDAQSIADSLTDEGKKSGIYRAFMAKMEMEESVADLPALDSLEEAVHNDPDDLPARYQLAQALMARAQYPDAMDHLLEIIQRDRSFEDDGARKLMLKVFELLGGSGDIVNTYRSKLSRLLF